MAIGGERREPKEGDFAKKVGLFEAEVVAVNPTLEQFKDILNIELKEDSKAVEYLGESKDGNATVRVCIWLRDVKSKQNFSVNFFLENVVRQNKDATKKQYINFFGSTTWTDDEDQLPTWFLKGKQSKPYREAHVGEEELHEFLRMWLPIDFEKDETAELILDFKKLIKGNVKEIRDNIGGKLAQNIVALATVVVSEKDGEVKEYQGVYNKGFLPVYTLKQFRNNDYSSPKLLASLAAKKPKELKFHEKFVLRVTGEYGCKHHFVLKELMDYDPESNLVASDKAISEDEGDY